MLPILRTCLPVSYTHLDVYKRQAGGFLDAYTYISRGGVFANAQTGNIVLLGVNAADKQWGRVVQYLIPIAAFAVGVFAAEQIKWHFKERKEIHWRQLTVLLEIVILAAVAFMPKELNWLANTAVSFACAVQVESFRKVRGSAFATTMCTGNLRSGTELLGNYLRTGDRELGKKSIKYYGIILSFIVGAGGGYLITEIMGIQAVLVCCCLLYTSGAGDVLYGGRGRGGLGQGKRLHQSCFVYGKSRGFKKAGDNCSRQRPHCFNPPF